MMHGQENVKIWQILVVFWILYISRALITPHCVRWTSSRHWLMQCHEVSVVMT